MDEKRANLWPPLSSQVFACFILNSFLWLIGCWSASIPQRFFHLLMLYIPRWESEELAAATTLPPLRQAETVGAFSREQTAVFIRIFMGAEGQLRGSSSAAYSMQSNSFTQRDRTWARIQRLDGRNAKELGKKKKKATVMGYPQMNTSLCDLISAPVSYAFAIHYPLLPNIGRAYARISYLYM